jgi:hypothetical protein
VILEGERGHFSEVRGGFMALGPQNVLVPVSTGELIDKVTILRIKAAHILDPAKLKNILAELSALTSVCDSSGIDHQSRLTKELQAINQKLWDIEDKIREKERAKAFDQEFIQLARDVYISNDERFRLKSLINEATGSTYREEKSYKQYL